MVTIYVQFSDGTKETIISAFTGPQNEEAFPNQGTVTSDDGRWQEYFATIPSELAAAWPTPAGRS
ncbi:hypothetical protein [Burkholderia sp. Ed8]|uniref:hypothetical protein n=1 Tax=Burkholderia sp. Ed8 TaxID=3112957 RepID=UPI00345CEC91